MVGSIWDGYLCTERKLQKEKHTQRTESTDTLCRAFCKLDVLHKHDLFTFKQSVFKLYLHRLFSHLICNKRRKFMLLGKIKKA